MEYPSDFPPESRARVAAERLRAGKDFDEAREHAPHRAYGSTVHLEAELRRYILRQFAVFTSEACELVRQGIWSVERVEEADIAVAAQAEDVRHLLAHEIVDDHLTAVEDVAGHRRLRLLPVEVIDV